MADDGPEAIKQTDSAIMPEAPTPLDTQHGSGDQSLTRPSLMGRVSRLFSTNKADSQTLMDTLVGDPVDSALVNAPRTRREMIERVIAFDEKRVFDVMIPRADICAVDQDMALDELIHEFSEAGHSRMPVYSDDLDNPQGMVHIKDLVSLLSAKQDTQSAAKPEASKTPQTLSDITRKVLYVPPSMRVVDLFLRMQVSRIHMALVIDEYGGTDGLVTIEDLIEEIVGEINDEHDTDDGPLVRERKAGGWEADARAELEELEGITGVTLANDDDDVDTLGGLVFALAGRVPIRGEIIAHPSGLEIEVTDADVRRIRKLRIRHNGAGNNIAPTLTSGLSSPRGIENQDTSDIGEQRKRS